MKNKQITIVDVAKAAGVSIATVSNVLNRRNVPLTEETIRKVEEAASELGYRRNVMAASLSRKKTYELGLLIPGFNGYFGDFAREMQDTLHELGYHLSVFSTSHSPDLEQRHLEALLQRRVDGLFCHGLAMSPELTRAIVGEGTPLVLFNAWGWPDEVAVGAVNLDFAGGCETVVHHLAEQGCRSFYYIGRKQVRATDMQRRIGFAAGLEKLEAGLVERSGIVESDGVNWEAAARELITLSEGTSQPVGVLAFDDLDAFALISALREKGYPFPGPYKVAGINDQFLARYNSPGITSLAIPLSVQVQQAVELLFRHMGEETSSLFPKPCCPDEATGEPPRKGACGEIKIPLKLVIRSSTL